jgi:hypothetical protein
MDFSSVLVKISASHGINHVANNPLMNHHDVAPGCPDASSIMQGSCIML